MKGHRQKQDVDQRALLSTAEVTAMLGASRTTLWEMEKRDQLPKAIVLNRRCKRWRADEIRAYIAGSTG